LILNSQVAPSNDFVTLIVQDPQNTLPQLLHLCYSNYYEIINVQIFEIPFSLKVWQMKRHTCHKSLHYPPAFFWALAMLLMDNNLKI